MEKYQTIRPIGKGSYGDVFLVRNLVDRKQYVLKKIFIKKSSKENCFKQTRILVRQAVCDRVCIPAQGKGKEESQGK